MIQILEKLAARGFSLRQSPRYERHLIVEKHGCAALLEPTPEGRWRKFSAPGYLIDGQIALLVEREGTRFFVHKSKQIAAAGEELASFQRFVRELDDALAEA
jgi:hypothetical protein